MEQSTAMSTFDRAEIVVDLAAIRHNVRLLQGHTGVPLIVVVKADGYGHGMAPCAEAASCFWSICRRKSPFLIGELWSGPGW